MTMEAQRISPEPVRLDFERMTTRDRFASVRSKLMFGLCIAFAVCIVVLLFMVIGYLVSIGLSSLSWSFFTKDPIPQGMAGYPGGMRQALVGTVILVALASVVGLPVGMLTGIYLAEYEVASWLATPVRFICDVLAGVPSIVVGILGYELVVVPMGHNSGWAGAAALGFIMVPIVARTSEEMLRLVPNSYREAAVALGATKSSMILGVVMPSATGALVTGVMLAIARVAGETAPLIFTALGSRYLTFNPNAPFPSLTKQIFDYAEGPEQAQQHAAWAGIIVLILLIFVVNLSVRYFISRPRR